MNSKETAKHLLVKKVPYLNKEKKVRDAQKTLQKNNFENIDYIYLKNKEELCGVLSIKELFKNHPNTKLKNIMKTTVYTAQPNTDQEIVAKLAMDKDIKSVPVTKNNKLIGVIPHHTILDILHEEGIEDVLFTAGIEKFNNPAKEIIHASTLKHIKKRLPWLIVGLIGGILAALTVTLFENMLQVYVILAAFIPAVVYMADAIGNQTQTIFIRSMALEKLNFARYVWREIKVNLMLAAILGTIFYGTVLLFWQDHFFGLVIGVSIFVTAMVAVLVGTGLPWLFNKIDYDPAISTGPFSTAVIDLVSLLLYFAIATMMIQMFL